MNNSSHEVLQDTDMLEE